MNKKTIIQTKIPLTKEQMEQLVKMGYGTKKGRRVEPTGKLYKLLFTKLKRKIK
jgi:hypothetical protein